MGSTEVKETETTCNGLTEEANCTGNDKCKFSDDRCHLKTEPTCFTKASCEENCYCKYADGKCSNTWYGSACYQKQECAKTTADTSFKASTCALTGDTGTTTNATS